MGQTHGKGIAQPQFQWNFLVVVGCKDTLGVHLTGESRGIKNPKVKCKRAQNDPFNGSSV